MTRDQIQAQGLVKIKRMSFFMILGYAVIVIAAVLGITVFAVTKYDDLTKDKVSTMTSTLNVQLRLNLDNYLNRMEKVATLAYSVDNAYTYDATDPTNDEYDSINTEKQIADGLSSLCLMENFVDYGIVYANNHTVGKISNGSVKLFGDSLYTDLTAMISRARTHDGWSTGYNGDYERIYYVKQMNENAVFVISFYTAELETVFDNPENLSDMSIRLTDKTYNIIYSSEAEDMAGNTIPADILADIDGKDMAVVSGNDNLSTINSTNGDWYIICSIPTQIILKEAVDMRKYIYLAAAFAALIAIVAGAVFVKRMADPVGTVTGSLSEEISEDGFENILGSRFFRDKADNVISKSSDKQSYAVIIASINNFLELLTVFDREFVDTQIARMVNITKAVCPDCECIGRVAENSFAILMKSNTSRDDTFRSLVVSHSVDICDMYRQKEKTPNAETYELSASTGASIGTGAFQEIYDKAYLALCESEKSGKGIFTMGQ